MDRVARRVVRSNAAFAMRWWVLLLVALCEVSSGLQPAAFRSVSRHHRVRQLAMAGEEEVSPAAPAAAPPRQARVLRQGAGIFAPVVLQAKKSFGVNEINALRAKVIAEHTKVIAKFVDTSESPFGRIALKALFEAADKDGNGTLDRDEVEAALLALGFTHLNDKKIEGIVARADVDDNQVIDFEEFCREAPKTLRTNLVKLAKDNGHDLGFLA